MLKLMRDNLKSLSWVLAFVVATFVFATFADWGGKGNWMGSGAGGGDWAAQVNGETIPRRELLSKARNLDNYYRSLLGESYNQNTLNLQIGQQAINQLVQERVILEHARALGLVATPQEISRSIQTDPSLQNESGFIGKDRYKALLRSSGIDTATYEGEIARQILRRKWAQLLTADIAVSDDQVAREVRRQDETADVVYAQFQSGAFAEDIVITDADLAAFYGEQEERYSRGEGRSFDLVMFDRLRAQSRIDVSEEEARAQYDAALASRFTIPEQRRASHLLIKTLSGAQDSEYKAARQRAAAALERARNGEEFAAIASELSEDTTAANGGDLGFFPRGVMAIPFEKAVWSMENTGDISDVVQTQFGYHIIQLTGIQEAHLKSFDEVRDELEKEIAFTKAGDQVRLDAEALVEAVRTNPVGFLDETARRSIVSSDSGIVHQGEPIVGIGVNPEVERALFSLAPDEISAPLPIARGYLVARFRESSPGGPPPLDEIRDTVESDLRRERAEARALARAREVAAATADKDLAALGEEMGFETGNAAGVRHGNPVGTLSTDPALEDAIFSAEIDQVQGPLELPGGPVVFTVTSRVEVGDDEIKARAAEVRQTLLAGRRQKLLAAVTRELSRQADVAYNTALIQQLDSPTQASSGS
ncbi:MAG: peptidyl-prolyl cis-trans isomerase [Acidobacteria bacterium]|nr:peptidyl-prolyl cis-trans isomerase [Acidobacteriota bacterium]